MTNRPNGPMPFQVRRSEREARTEGEDNQHTGSASAGPSILPSVSEARKTSRAKAEGKERFKEGKDTDGGLSSRAANSLGFRPMACTLCLPRVSPLHAAPLASRGPFDLPVGTVHAPPATTMPYRTLHLPHHGAEQSVGRGLLAAKHALPTASCTQHLPPRARSASSASHGAPPSPASMGRALRSEGGACRAFTSGALWLRRVGHRSASDPAARMKPSCAARPGRLRRACRGHRRRAHWQP